MLIKNKNYWKEYNQRRKTYIQQKNKERYSKDCINTTDKDTTKPIQPINTTDTTSQINTTIPQVVLKKDTTEINTTEEQIQPINTTPEKIIQPIQPKAELMQLLKCPRCPEIETSITNFANLYYQEQEKNKELTKELKNSQQAIQASQKSCQEASKVINDYQGIVKELQQPINPTIERWKTDYFTLQKQTNHQLSEQSETINRLKEKLREKDKEKSEWEQKYRRLENQAKNNNNSLSIPNLNHLITKHTKIQNSQHLYNEKDVRERQFLKSLLDKLYQFN